MHDPSAKSRVCIQTFHPDISRNNQSIKKKKIVVNNRIKRNKWTNLDVPLLPFVNVRRNRVNEMMEKLYFAKKLTANSKLCGLG